MPPHRPKISTNQEGLGEHLNLKNLKKNLLGFIEKPPYIFY